MSTIKTDAKNKRKLMEHEICSKCEEKAEYYMLDFKLWDKVSQKNKYPFLCFNCVKDKLKRKLTNKDFIDAPINKGVFGFYSEEYVKNQK